ncbi:MAG TPA: hypothetical protein PKA90_08670 [Ignavibacteria bacterium]|nr:hypothetical protein [Ignavibacteria bacterium]HMR40492.1 hypothetical protein [Ignavibacteria bacterium]
MAEILIDRNPAENPDKNVLIVLLKTFSPEEWKEFEKFVSSPYFNKGRNYLPLLKILRIYYPEFNSKDLTKEKIYKKLYPLKEYKDSVLNSMYSRLYNLGEEFLVQQEFNKDFNIRKECMAVRVINNRGLGSKARKRIEEIENHFKLSKKSKDFFVNKKIFTQEISYFYYNNEMRRSIFEVNYEAIKYIIYGFISELFHYDFSLYSQRNFWKFDYEASYVNKIIELINFDKIFELTGIEDKAELPFLKINYLMHMTGKYPESDEYYFELKKLVYDNLDKLDEELKRLLLNLLALICTSKFVSGRNEFKFEAFEIKKKAIEEDLFSMTNTSYIKTSEFRSVFIEALNVNQKEWAEDFAEKYLDKLSPDIREDIDNYCKARIAYENRNFDEAVEYAMKVNINLITFKLDMKNTIAKIYYDTDSVETLFSHLNAYYQLVKNSDSQNTEFLQRHIKFIKYLKALQNIRLNFKNKTEYEFLKNKISKENVTAKSWLIYKIDQLIKPDKK